MPQRSRQQVPPIGGEQEGVEEQEETTPRARGGGDMRLEEQEETTPRARGGGDMRFTTGDLIKLRDSMSEAALKKIKELGFEDCLKISLFALGCRDLIRSLDKKCKLVESNGQSYILFDMDPENPLYLTAEALSVILGVRKGTDCTNSNAKPSALSMELGPLLRRISNLGPREPIYNSEILALAKFAKDVGDVDMEVKLFLVLLFNGLLMPNTSHNISSRSMAYAEDLESIGKYDWPKLAIDNIADSFHKNAKAVFNPASLLIFFLDIMDSNHHEDGEPIVPRVNFYTTEMVLQLTSNLDMQKIKFKPWKDTVYAKKGVEQPQIDENIVQLKKVRRKRPRQDARKRDKMLGKRTICKEKECAEDGTSVPIPLLKELLKPFLEVLPGDIQSSAIRAVDLAQQELASQLKHVIKDYVSSRATIMASQFQALYPNESASTSKGPTSLGEDPVMPHPVTPLDHGSPFHPWDHTRHPVNPFRDSASLPPYPVLSSRLASAACIPSTRKRKHGKWPDTCKKLAQSFVEVAAKNKQQRTEETEKETGMQGSKKEISKRRQVSRWVKKQRTNCRILQSKYADPPYASPLFVQNMPTKDVVDETINHLYSCKPKSEEETLILIRGLSFSKNTLISMLTKDKISMDLMRAFLICKRSDDNNGQIFFFMPHLLLECIEGKALKHDFEEQNGSSNVSENKYKMVFIPVITSDGSMLVFWYSSLHNTFGFLSCNESDESQSEGMNMCEPMFNKMESTIGKKNGLVRCLRRSCHVQWSDSMRQISDGTLLALLFMECFNGVQPWLKDEIVTNCKGIFVRYLLYHKLNGVALPMEFNNEVALPNKLKRRGKKRQSAE